MASLCTKAFAQEEPEPAPSAPAPAPPLPQPAAPTTGTIIGTVEAPDLDAPIAGATVTIVGTTISATTDDQGNYSLDAAPGVLRVRADFAGFRSEERVVNVAAGASATLDFALATAPLITQTVVAVGSRTPRTNVDSPVAVDVITAEDISRSGRTETGRVLSQLEPSYLSVPQTIADGTDHVDPASLRGLGPDQVLVLVNGKRRHRSALLHVNGTFGRGTVGTDLNAFPLGAIKRIEVLRDGAASQYGSDAIAGVINIVTKDSTDKLDVSNEAGITASGDGVQLYSAANYGFKVGEKGFVNLTGEFLQRDATNRTGAYTGPVYSNDPAVDNQTLGMRGLTRDQFRMRIGEAAATTGMGEFDLELPFSGDAVFYSFGDVSHRRGDAGGFYRMPVQETQNVPEFYPDGFLPLIRPVMDDQSITVGIRKKGPWNVDASLTHGTSAFRFDIENSVNASLGTASPTTFDAGTLSSSETVANLDLLHKLDTDVVKSLAIVLGTELRVENYQIIAGDPASYQLGTATTPGGAPKLPGAQVFPGFQPSNEVDRTRDNIGIYGGVESELNKAIALDVGGRFESYSDFGQSLIGKAAARAKLGGGLSLRAAVNTGFRAPSLQQLWFSNVSTQFLPDAMGNLMATQVLTSNNESPVTKAFGIPKLHEEKSTNLSTGVGYRPLDNLSITADGYFIRIRDRIALTSQFANTDPAVAQILAPFPGVSQAQFFANAVDTDTSGADLVADYAVGPFTVTGKANFSKTVVTHVNIPSSLMTRLGGDPMLQTFFFGRAARNRLEDLIPHERGFVAVRYAASGISALVRASYYGKAYFKPDNAANDETFGARVLVDLDLGYSANKNVYFAIGADNLFDTFPDAQTKDANKSFGRFLYSRNVSQFGMNGGFYYGKLRLTF
ncbi:MAG TPA: TonB-dependent receptor [Kofleriaceae bacterium]|nr:TonB-dependent receptor [Kofleriaceae bacterium]